MTPDITIAVLADIHGNSLALTAVLADIAARGITRVYNLGDSLYGPLDPQGTFKILSGSRIIHLMGNGDRELLRPAAQSGGTMNQLRRLLTEEQRGWIKALSPVIELPGLMMCHGTPCSDEEYLLEKIGPKGVELKTPEEVEEALWRLPFKHIVCGHSHRPDVFKRLGGGLVVNVGSVGLPAYEDFWPVRHKMESGSPHAKYAVLTISGGGGLSAEIIEVEYDWMAAADMAERNGRADWAGCLRTGEVNFK